MNNTWIQWALLLLLVGIGRVSDLWSAETNCDQAANPADCHLEYADQQAQTAEPSFRANEDIKGVEVALALMNALTASMAFGSIGAPSTCPSSISYQIFIWTARLQSFFEILWFRGFSAQSAARAQIFTEEMKTEAGDYAQLLAYDYLVAENNDTANYYEKKYQYHTLVGAIYVGAGVLAALELMGVICLPTNNGISVRFTAASEETTAPENTPIPEDTAISENTSTPEESPMSASSPAGEGLSTEEDTAATTEAPAATLAGASEEQPSTAVPADAGNTSTTRSLTSKTTTAATDTNDPYARYSNDPQTKKMLDQLDLNAEDHSTGYCARYVKCALWEGNCSSVIKGYQLSQIDASGYLATRPGGNANSMPTIMAQNGFTNIYTGANGTYTSANPPVGAVLTYSGGKHGYGHVEVYNGKYYVSDFRGRRPIDAYNYRYRLTGIYVKK